MIAFYVTARIRGSVPGSATIRPANDDWETAALFLRCGEIGNAFGYRVVRSCDEKCDVDAVSFYAIRHSSCSV